MNTDDKYEQIVDIMRNNTCTRKGDLFAFYLMGFFGKDCEDFHKELILEAAKSYFK